MKIIDCVQGSAEWHSARAGKVTASRVADVLAQGRNGAPSATRAAYMGELIAERLTGRLAEDGWVSAEMLRGTELEPAARAAYEAEAGELVTTVGFVLHPTIEHAGASPDGLVGGDGLVEFKCPKTHTHLAYLLAGKPPAEYIKQMAWQCAVTGRRWCDFASFDPRLPEDLQLFVVRYEPSAAYLAELTAGVVAFIAEMDRMLAELRQLTRPLADTLRDSIAKAAA